METTDFLHRERQAILEEAEVSLARMHVHHYEAAGPGEAGRRLAGLFDQLLDALAARNLGAMIGYAETIAEERFHAGFDLYEVQIAFNALEEATWRRVFHCLEPADFAQTLGLIGTVFGAAKDALARKYVSLATKAQAPALDLRALFAGGEGT